MALKDLWKLMFKSKNHNHDFNDEDRAHALEMRRIKHETERMRIEAERTRIESEKRRAEVELKKYDELLCDDDYDDDVDDGDDMSGIISAIPKVLTMMKGGGGQNHSEIETPPSQPPPIISDDDLRAFIAKQSRQNIKMAKTLPKNMFLNQSMQKFGINQQDSERAYSMLHTEF